MTSSPGPTLQAISANNSASLPEAQAMACFAWQYTATARSRSWQSGPSTNRPEEQTRWLAAVNSPSKAAYCRCISISGTPDGTGKDADGCGLGGGMSGME